MRAGLSQLACLLTVTSWIAFSATAGAQEAGPKNKASSQPEEPSKPKPQITISRETTYLTEPLTKSGYVNYAKAIDDEYRKGVTPENNFAVVFWQTLGPKAITPVVRDQFFEALGIELPPEDGDYYVTLNQMDERVAAREGKQPGDTSKLLDQQGKAAEGPWSADDLPELAEWVRTNDKHLDRMVEASRRERFYSPMPGGGDPPLLMALMLPAEQHSRDVARGLTTRAMLRVSEGDIELAWRDLLTCHRLARLVGQNPTLIGQLVAIAIETMACRADAHLAHHGKLTERQARAFQKDFGNLPSMPPLVDKIDRTERFMFLDMVAALVRDPENLDELFDGNAEADGMMVVKKLLGSSLVDWDVPLKAGNAFYDRLVEAMKKSTFSERKVAIADIDRELVEARNELTDAAGMAKSFLGFRSPRKTVGQHMGKLLIALWAPALAQSKEAENRWTTRVNLQPVMWALAGYHARHGRYPTKLDQLVPDYILEIPTDLYSEDALIYKSDGTGYLLYSVGQNQTDDGGQTFDSEPAGDDIVIRTPE